MESNNRRKKHRHDRTEVHNISNTLGQFGIEIPPAKNSTFDLSTIPVSVVIVSEYSRTPLRHAPILRGPLCDVDNATKILYQLSKADGLNDQLLEHYGLDINRDYKESFFTFTDHTRHRRSIRLRNLQNVGGEIGEWKSNLQAGLISYSPPCDCVSNGYDSNGHSHGPEIHVSLKLDRLPEWVETLQHLNSTNKAAMEDNDEEIRQQAREIEMLKGQIAERDQRIADLQNEIEAWKLNQGLNAGQTEKRTTRSQRAKSNTGGGRADA